MDSLFLSCGLGLYNRAPTVYTPLTARPISAVFGTGVVLGRETEVVLFPNPQGLGASLVVRL